MPNLERQMIDMVNRNADCKYLERKLKAISKRRNKKGAKK